MSRADEIGNPQETIEVDKAWLAGVIEGDGSIGMGFHLFKSPNLIKRFAVKPTISFSNQDGLLIERVVHLLAALSGKNPRIREVPSGSERGRSSMWVALTGMESVQSVLQAIMPYLQGEKAARARLLHQFIASRMERHKGRGPLASRTPYNEEELLLIQQCRKYCRGKGGRLGNPEIDRILNEYTRAITAK